MPRKTYFEHHIRPLIRELDREQMLSVRAGFDLWDPNVVKANATQILSLLENTDSGSIMPPMAYGGPWPEEWINLFKKWMTDGYLSLELGSSTHYEAQRYPEFVVLTATVTKTDPKYAVWPTRYFGPTKAGVLPDIVLYQELRDIVPPQITDEGVGIFEMPTSVVSLQVLDSTGVHAVPITVGAPESLSPQLAKRIKSRVKKR